MTYFSPNNRVSRGLCKQLFSTVLFSIALNLFTANASANTVTVKELSTSPNRIVSIDVNGFYEGGAYAGVVNMLVDGVATTGFCIDPFHFSSSAPLEYQVVSLSEAPKSFDPIFDGGMGALKADKISKLWAMAYTPFGSSIGSSQAAAIQVAIWEIVAGGRYDGVDNFDVVYDYGASALLDQLDAWTGQGANLVALTGPGQDYVVQHVPEAGATAVFLAMSFGAMTLARRFRH